MPPVLELSIDRATTAQRLADALSKKLLSGEIPPGTVLREVALSKSVGVARSTTREALQILAAEGLLTHSVHRGMSVKRLTVEELDDLFRARAVLEQAAVAASPSAPDEARRRFADLATSLSEPAREGDWLGFADRDARFHGALVGFLGSKRLDACFGQIAADLRLVINALDRSDDDLVHQAGRHQHFAALLLSGDVAAAGRDLAEQLAIAHVQMREIVARDQGAAGPAR